MEVEELIKLNPKAQRDYILSEMNAGGGELKKGMSELITMARSIGIGEEAMKVVQIGDIWKYELTVTKLREPAYENKKAQS